MKEGVYEITEKTDLEKFYRINREKFFFNFVDQCYLSDIANDQLWSLEAWHIIKIEISFFKFFK